MLSNEKYLTRTKGELMLANTVMLTLSAVIHTRRADEAADQLHPTLVRVLRCFVRSASAATSE